MYACCSGVARLLVCYINASRSDLALHSVIVTANDHCREDLLLDAVSPEPTQHRLAPLWNALQQYLHG